MDPASICIVLEKSYPYQDEFDASLKGIIKGDCKGDSQFLIGLKKEF